jgi:hypothetical protein
MSKVPCMYCLNDHKYVCDCGHAHDRHTQGGACQYKTCECEGYSQHHQRLPDETTKDFNDRILGKKTKAAKAGKR